MIGYKQSILKKAEDCVKNVTKWVLAKNCEVICKFTFHLSQLVLDRGFALVPTLKH